MPYSLETINKHNIKHNLNFELELKDLSYFVPDSNFEKVENLVYSYFSNSVSFILDWRVKVNKYVIYSKTLELLTKNKYFQNYDKVLWRFNFKTESWKDYYITIEDASFINNSNSHLIFWILSHN